MPLIALFITFHGKDTQKYELDTEVPIEQHINNVAQLFGAPGSPTLYGLQISSTYIFLKTEDLRNSGKLTPGSLLELKLRPSHQQQTTPEITEIQKFMEDLQSVNENIVKKACFSLRRDRMKDEKFAKEFKQQNGIPVLTKLIQKTKGNTLAYSLGALDEYMHHASDYNFLGTSLMERLVSCIFDGNLNVSKTALSICNQFTCSSSPSKGAIIFMTRRKDTLDYDALLQMLDSTDLELKIQSLTFINNLIDNLPEKEATECSYQTMLESHNIHQYLANQVSVESRELKMQLVRYQRYWLRVQNRERVIPYDETNEQHLVLLKKLWSAIFPDKQWEGPIGDHWKLIGFQGKNPKTDFRAMGLMGLKHLLYFAETYPQKFRKIVEGQLAEEGSEQQYPVAAAGINISQVIMNLFKVSEDVDLESCIVYPFLFTPNAYLELYCIVFQLLDYKWTEMRATYMQFQSVFLAVRGIMEEILGKGLVTIQQIQNSLLLNRNQDELELQIRTRSVGKNNQEGSITLDRPISPSPRERETISTANVSKLCDRCEEQPAVLKCVECGDLPFCEDCAQDIHQKGRWKSHTLQALEGQSRSKNFSPPLLQPSSNVGNLNDSGMDDNVFQSEDWKNLSCFHDVSREEAEKMILDKGVMSCYLLRPTSRSNNCLALTCKSEYTRNQTIHFIVEKLSTGGYFIRDCEDKETYSSMEELLNKSFVLYNTTPFLRQDKNLTNGVKKPQENTVPTSPVPPRHLNNEQTKQTPPEKRKPVGGVPVYPAGTIPQIPAQKLNKAPSGPPNKTVGVGSPKFQVSGQTQNNIKFGDNMDNTLSKKDISQPRDEEFDEEKEERLRTEVVKEIFATERLYITDLNVLLEVFLLPLKLTGALGVDDINVLFSNVETLVNCNSQLLKDWELSKKKQIEQQQSQQQPQVDDIVILGQVFEKMSPFFKMYTVYCANQPKATIKLQELKQKNHDFVHALKICESDPRTKGLNLLSYLIKPIQRICKYPLFFRELLKHTSPKDSLRHTVLVNALNKIEEVTDYINEGKRIAEKLQRIVEIQQSIDTDLDLVTISRRFIREGPILLTSNNSELQESYIFLFNDLFLITRQKKKGFEYKGQVFLTEARIVDVADTEIIKNAFEISVERYKFTFCAPSREEKNSWLKDLKVLKKEFLKKQLKKDTFPTL